MNLKSGYITKKSAGAEYIQMDGPWVVDNKKINKQMFVNVSGITGYGRL